MRASYFLLALLLGIPLARSQTPLVPRGSVWKYFSFGEANENWFRTTFDDSDWPSGPGQLGYGEGDEQTVVEETPARAPTTIYYRRPFVITNLSQIEIFTLRLVADDGAVVYLNERELLRRNMPAGPVSFGTEALSNLETNENTFHQFGFGSVNLTPGTNLLSVEIHQHSAGRTDSSFDVELIANLPLLPPNI